MPSASVILVAHAIAFQNIVDIHFVPPNECVFWATIGVGGNQELVSTLINFSSAAITSFPQKTISTSTTAVGGYDWTVADYIYVFYQSRLRRVDGVLSAAPQMQLAGASVVADMALLVSLDPCSALTTVICPMTTILPHRSTTFTARHASTWELCPRASPRTCTR